MASASNQLLNSSAIDIKKVCKSFGSGRAKTEVLKNVNLNVSKGSIYGLLGPSGCGKTTLLKCIVGRLKLDSGKIFIFDHQLGSRNLKIPGSDVGYMPQELALYEDLKIFEILRYYGGLYGMSKNQITLKTLFLLNFLQLPNKNRLIKTLSGGQKRRVSFAIALFYEPPLLILDEPTVGVDPLLRQNIWQHLFDLTQTGGVTVVITTHYVEETKQANKIGFMRNGRILVEDNPNSLQTSDQPLENIFLDICFRDDYSQTKLPEDNTQSDAICKREEEEVTFLTKTKKLLFCPRFANVQAVAMKNCKLLSRSFSTLMLQFFFPSFLIATQCMSFGRPLHDLTVAVVNSDNKFGPKLLSYIDDVTINQIIVPDFETGVSMVKDRKAVGILELSENFTAGLIDRYLSPSRITQEALNSSRMKLHLDMTDLQIVYTLQAATLKAYENFGRFTLQDYSYNEELASSPLKISKAVYGKIDIDFRNYAFPSVTLLIIFFFAIILTGLTSISERNSGVFDRNIVAGISQWEVMMGQTIIQGGIVTVQITTVLLVALLGFGLSCEGNLGLVVQLSVFVGICGMSYGYTLSAVSNYESTAVTLIAGTFFPMLLLSAVMWPIEGMPSEMQTLTKFLPLTLPNEAIRSILSRGIGLHHSCVWLGFVSCFVWIFNFSVLNVIITKIKS